MQDPIKKNDQSYGIGCYVTEADIPNPLFLKEQTDLRGLLHFHDSIELVLVRKGEVIVHEGKHSFAAHPGSIIYIPSFLSHCYEWKGDLDTAVLMISDFYQVHFQEAYPNREFPFLMNNVKANEKIFALVNQWVKDGNDDRLMNVGYVNLLFSFLAEAYPPREITHDPHEDHLAIRLLRYIHEHYYEDITLEDMADEFSYSIAYVSKSLKGITGRNFREYLNLLRLRKVQEALLNENQESSLAEIIESCGFSSTATYYRAKKRYNNGPDFKA